MLIYHDVSEAYFDLCESLYGWNSIFVFSFWVSNNELWDIEEAKLMKDDNQILLLICILDTLKCVRKVPTNMNIKLMFLMHTED